ncbi:3951_t:CDS:2 [Entrophospora sp. SA101]|nr:61_t:CDS:2 [Entrophospora sp. SA101]CAJ0846280.1 12247_t:CDS:2 [Entrophospora sp. SA101]CAJ0877755.1 3951_t:CDS:2 [Entrophospora sp. SA101]CAJ0916671.1 18938_t:CDS:2 [Entrophospora sp. SA101]
MIPKDLATWKIYAFSAEINKVGDVATEGFGTVKATTDTYTSTTKYFAGLFAAILDTAGIDYFHCGKFQTQPLLPEYSVTKFPPFSLP